MSETEHDRSKLWQVMSIAVKEVAVTLGSDEYVAFKVVEWVGAGRTASAKDMMDEYLKKLKYLYVGFGERAGVIADDIGISEAELRKHLRKFGIMRKMGRQ